MSPGRTSGLIECSNRAVEPWDQMSFHSLIVLTAARFLKSLREMVIKFFGPSIVPRAARRSAVSLPRILQWPGTQMKETLLIELARRRMALVVPEWFDSLSKRESADLESVAITVDFAGLSEANWRALRMAKSSMVEMAIPGWVAS